MKRILSSAVAVCTVLSIVFGLIANVYVASAETFWKGFLLSFEDSNPFDSISNVYNGAEHWTSDGIGTVSGAEALNGSSSLKISDISDKNSETRLKIIDAPGMPEFSKTDFSEASGIAFRIKIADGEGSLRHKIMIALRQSGVAKATWLGKQSVAYDTDGSRVEISTENLGLYLPAGFDGFVFLPFRDARSEQVTVPGSYDTYQTYPDSMVDLSENYTLQMYLGDSSWNGSDVYIDDICVYSGEETADHYELLRSLGYSISAVAQPSRYSLPLSFEEQYNPFVNVNNIYDNAEHISGEGIALVSGNEALNGIFSLKVGPIREGNQRTMLTNAAMKAEPDFSKTDFSKISGIMLRIKISGYTGTASHRFTVALRQDGVAKATWLGYGSSAYDLAGNKIEITTENLGLSLPSGFDGFVFMPLEYARSEQVTEPGYYDNYQTHPESMVDLSKDYSFQIYLNDETYNGTTVYIDDINYYSGHTHGEHLEFIKSLGYATTAVVQPSRYSFPLPFDNGLMPFTSVSNVYDDAEHVSSEGVALVSGSEALNGTASVKVGPIREGNQRTILTNVPMTAVDGFSKTDFSKVTGIALRIKLTGDSSGTHKFTVALRQDGVQKPTWLGYGAAAYDLSGEIIEIKTEQLALNLPAGFDGFVFIPLESARSEQVTEPGYYDTYQSYPENMVDLSKEFNMQIYFHDETWNGMTVYMDDIGIYSGTDAASHYEYLEKLGYVITAVAQPERYSLPLSFDEEYNPFITVTDVYDNAEHPAKGGIGLVGGTEMLNGVYSLKVGPIRDGNQRTLLTNAKMAAESNFSVSDFSKITGIMLRIKITGGGKNGNHRFTVALRQDGVGKPTWLGYGAVAYDLKGEKVDITSEQLAAVLPEGFDGFLFLPLESARSEQVTVPGYYDNYQTYPENMVDLSKDYNMQIYFHDETWNGSTVYIDDISFYGGSTHKEHIELLNSLGYNTSAVIQPSRYSFPIIFDDGLMPFTSVNDVYDNASHWKNEGVQTVTGSSALVGSTSLMVGKIAAGNQRTELNVVDMAAIPGFSKSDFSKVSGLMLRVKIIGGDSSVTKNIAFAINQEGLEKRTWLGNNASAYDLEGNPLQLRNANLEVVLTGNFDGYLFLPFEDARSEVVTVPGYYDSYQTYPGNMADFSKDYTLQIMFNGDVWGNTSVYIDDMRIYSGNKHINILKELYDGIITVQQPDYYTLPFDFAGGMTPFKEPLDGGLYVQNNGEYGTGGTLTYELSDIQNRKAMKIKFADNLTDAYSVYTSKALVQGADNMKGFVLRVKTDCKESATFGIMTDWLTDDSTVFGSGAVLYDTKGNIVDQPREKYNWLGIGLPADFDGFIFIPYERGFIEKRSANCSAVDGWKFSNKQRLMQLIFHGEEQWQGATFTVDYFGEYSDTNYVGLIESLGYEIKTESAIYWRDIYGTAADKFFYNIRLNEVFDAATLDELTNWTVLNGEDYGGKSSFAASNVRLGNNSLIIGSSKSGDSYTTGGVRSAAKYSYGYYEAVITLPEISGIDSLFRLVTDGDYRAGGTAFEIDIAYLNELYELKTGYRYMENHTPLEQGGKVIDGGAIAEINDDFAGVSHTYGLLYTYDYLRFYVDGELVRVVENDFARGGTYIELAQTVTGEVNGDLNAQSSEMHISNVSYWEIDMDEMSRYDALTDEEKLMLGAGGTDTSGGNKVAPGKSVSRVFLILSVTLGVADIICLAVLAVTVISGKKKGRVAV